MRIVRMLSRRQGIVLDVRGELDVATAGQLRRVLRRVERSERPVAVTLSGVSFADSSGLEPLAESALRRARAGRSPLLVDSLSHPVERVLELLGADWTSQVDGTPWRRTPRGAATKPP